MKSIRAIMLAGGLLASACAFGQQAPAREFTKDFSSVSASGHIRLRLVAVQGGEQPSISVEEREEESRFEFKVDEKGRLTLREAKNRKRGERTLVEVRYRELTDLRIFGADASFEGVASFGVIDITLGDGAILVAELDCADLSLDISGKSSASLDGQVRYLTVRATGAKLDMRGVEATSAEVRAVQGAEVYVQATERLVATAATTGAIFYKGDPGVVRVTERMMGSVNDISER